jgi:hypothetical protein
LRASLAGWAGRARGAPAEVPPPAEPAPGHEIPGPYGLAGLLAGYRDGPPGRFAIRVLTGTDPSL